MSDVNGNSQHDVSDKKAQVLGRQKGGMSKILMGVMLLAVLAGAAAAGWWWISADQPQATVSKSGVSSNGEVVSIPAAMLDDGKARHFKYDFDGGPTVKFFVVKSSDGVVRAAFDACDVCWPQGKGYFQQGDNMVCANCGKAFPSVKVNEVKGGCNPAPLERMVKDGKVVIKVSDIAQGRRYFNFGQRG